MGSIFMVYIFVFLYISIFEMLNISCYGWNVFDFKLVHMAKLMANFALGWDVDPSADSGNIPGGQVIN